MSDLQELCPDSYENPSAATPETPLPGLTSCYNSSPFGYPPRAPLRAIQENGVMNNLLCPTEQKQQNVDAIIFRGTQMSTTALACVDVLFTEAELVHKWYVWLWETYVTCHRRFAKSFTRRLFNHNERPCVQKSILNAEAKEELL